MFVSIAGASLALLSLSQPAPPVSDQVGVYALIDRVELLPSAEAPERVRLHGAFAISEGKLGSYYRSAAWGVLEFHAREGAEEQCVTQWRDLAGVAGSGETVAFGGRYEQQGFALAPTIAEVESLPFSVQMGVRKVERAFYGPLQSLRSLPRPTLPIAGSVITPREGRRVAQKVTFQVQNASANLEGDRYLFRVECSNGDIRVSAPVTRGAEGTTQHDMWLHLPPGTTVKWSAHILRAELEEASVAGSSFRVGEQQQ